VVRGEIEFIFESVLKEGATKSAWVAWLNTDGRAQKTTRKFLKTCYCNLTPDEQSKWAQRVSAGDEKQTMATIHELVAFGLLQRLQLAPQYEPSVDGLTPDISFDCSGQQFLADVFVTYNPERTVRREKHAITKVAGGDVQVVGEHEVVYTIDKGERAWKIEQDLTRKADRYANTGLPLIIFVFLGDLYGLRMGNVAEAVFGYYCTGLRFTREDVLAPAQHGRPYPPGLFLRKISGLPHPRGLSAVVACDWFDTLNRDDPGKRLDCRVFHYWDATCGLPISAFGDFPQVVWAQKGPDTWEWGYTTTDIPVAKFPSTGGIAFHTYTADEPW